MNDTVKYYDELAENYDTSRFNNSYGKFIDAQERIILNRLITNRHETILDLACGTGRLLNYAQIGIDASPKMIEMAKNKYMDKHVYVSDAANTSIESSSIDTIIMFHFLMHLDKAIVNDILKECNRILKTNGRLIFDIPSKKRREVLHHTQTGWHGATSFTISELEQHPDFSISNSYGILFLPIHHIPPKLRPYLLKIDLFLANSFLKEFSSYLIIELTKK